jgi:hypothetical protein
MHHLNRFTFFIASSFLVLIASEARSAALGDLVGKYRSWLGRDSVPGMPGAQFNFEITQDGKWFKSGGDGPVFQGTVTRSNSNSAKFVGTSPFHFEEECLISNSLFKLTLSRCNLGDVYSRLEGWTQSASEVGAILKEWGLVGRWSRNCSAPPSKDVAHITYGTGFLGGATSTIDTDKKVENKVDAAHKNSDGTLTFVVNNVRSTFSKPAPDQILSVESQILSIGYVNQGKPMPLYLCR